MVSCDRDRSCDHSLPCLLDIRSMLPCPCLLQIICHLCSSACTSNDSIQHHRCLATQLLLRKEAGLLHLVVGAQMHTMADHCTSLLVARASHQLPDGQITKLSDMHSHLPICCRPNTLNPTCLKSLSVHIVAASCSTGSADSESRARSAPSPRPRFDPTEYVRQRHERHYLASDRLRRPSPSPHRPALRPTSRPSSGDLHISSRVWWQKSV